jgi:hypothetical protein
MEPILSFFLGAVAALAIFSSLFLITKVIQKLSPTLEPSTVSPKTFFQSKKELTPDIKIISEIILKKMTGMVENSIYAFEVPEGLSFNGTFSAEYKKLCSLCLDKNLHLLSIANTAQNAQNTPNTLIEVFLLKSPKTIQDIIDNITFVGNPYYNLTGFIRYKIGSDMDHHALCELLQKSDNKGHTIKAIKRTSDSTIKVYYGQTHTVHLKKLK